MIKRKKFHGMGWGLFLPFMNSLIMMDADYQNSSHLINGWLDGQMDI
jgi:hypothetical protein